MTNHIDVLKKAREQMVKMRRDAADVLSQPFDRSKTPHALATFTEAQDAIEQIDKAIEDEQKQEPGSSGDFNKPLVYPKSTSV
jgi:hypothetical protein